MRSRKSNSGGLVAWLLILKRLIGTGVVLGVFYYTVPWVLISAVNQGEGLSPAEFTTAIELWVTGLADNILLIVLLMFIAVLTYGAKVLDLMGSTEVSDTGATLSDLRELVEFWQS